MENGPYHGLPSYNTDYTFVYLDKIIGSPPSFSARCDFGYRNI